MEKNKILIVDDEKQIIDLFKMFLKKEELEIISSTSYSEALDIIRKNNISLVLLDVYLSGNNGIDLLPKIKGIDPSLPVLMISGMSKVYDAVEALKRGAVDYLTKPIKKAELLSAVRRYIKNTNSDSDFRLNMGETTFIGKSTAIKTIIDKIEVIAPTSLNVLILGKSGTGKEVIARMIHNNSKRKDGPFIAVDCGALPENLIENELFGSTKGSYTGAEGQIGKFELAHGGTIFLDEITNLPIASQAKLLRVIQEKKFFPIGSEKEITIDFRIIATSNVDFEELIKQNRFRDDLYYRLNEIFLNLPELREREDDIILIADYFLSKANEEFNKKINGFSKETEELLLQYSWPGNVRELKHIIFTAVLYCHSDELRPEDLAIEIKHVYSQNDDFDGLSFTEIIRQTEKKIIINALEKCDWNKSEACKILQMHRKTLYRKIEDLNITKLGNNVTNET